MHGVLGAGQADLRAVDGGRVAVDVQVGAAQPAGGAADGRLPGDPVQPVQPAGGLGKEEEVAATDLAWVRLTTGADAVPGLLRLPGLDPATVYDVRAVDVTGRPAPRLPGSGLAQPAWCDGEGVRVSGAVLAAHGLAMPVLDPGAGLLVELVAVG